MSSPHGEDFHTGISSLNPQEALHSTENFGYTDREQWPSTWTRQVQRHQLQNNDEITDMSIEQGRGLKATVQSLDDDVSSNIRFDFRGDSQYEITGTPPITNRRASTKIEDGLKKQVLQRKANEGAKRSVSLAGLPSAMRQKEQQFGEDNISATLTLNPKNTRFARVKPRVASTSAVTQPAQQKAIIVDSSLQLPNMTGIEELINGPAGLTPQISSKLRQANTRFQPAKRHTSFARTADVERVPLQNVPVPEEEKKIYQSLQVLQEQMDAMRKELVSVKNQRADAMAQLADVREENEELKQALDFSQKRGTQHLCDEEEQAMRQWSIARTKVKADVKSLQQRLQRTERDLNQSELANMQMSKQTRELESQLGLAVYRVEEIEAENETLHEEHVKLRSKNEALMKGNKALRQEVEGLRAGMTHTRSNKQHNVTIGATDQQPATFVDNRSRHQRQPRSIGELDQQARQAIAEVVREQLFQRNHNLESKRSSHGWIPGTMTSQARQPIYAQRLDGQDEATATEFEVTNTGRLPLQNATNTRTDDLTNLTQPAVLDSEILRRSLEEKRRSYHLHRNVLAPALVSNDALAQQQVDQLNRRSSFKEVSRAETAGKTQRTVRVQSPEAEDDDVVDVDNSMISNIGRRRRSSAAREEGETSAFIIPDITIHSSQPRTNYAVIDSKHAKDCTICTAATGQQAKIPAIDSVSERHDLPADATLRPAEREEDALARVKKQNEDELVHLKLDLKHLEKEYHDHDPAIGARRRQELYKEITKLHALCEMKASQVYAMQDIHEAQKQRGQQSLPEQGRRVAQKVTIQDDDEDDFDVVTRTKANSARYAAQHSFGLDGASDVVSIGLPEWDGLSNDGA